MAYRTVQVTFALEFDDEEDGPDPLAPLHALFARGAYSECRDPLGKFMSQAYWSYLEQRTQKQDDWDARTPEQRADSLGITEKLRQWAAMGGPDVIHEPLPCAMIWPDDEEGKVVSLRPPAKPERPSDD